MFNQGLGAGDAKGDPKPQTYELGRRRRRNGGSTGLGRASIPNCDDSVKYMKLCIFFVNRTLHSFVRALDGSRGDAGRLSSPDDPALDLA
jgi:hypothetical protein